MIRTIFIALIAACFASAALVSGDFEGSNAAWNPASTNYGTDLFCAGQATDVDCTGDPHAGGMYLELYPGTIAEVATIQQTVNIPNDAISLNFYLQSENLGSSGTRAIPTFTVKIGGVTVLSISTQAAFTTYQGASYTLVTIPLTAGTTTGINKLIEFKYTSGAVGVNRRFIVVRVDDIALVVPPSMSGDPLIRGFHGEKFFFDGHADGIFNIYNDEYVNANSVFGKATESKGTVMRVVAVEIGGHQISFNIDDDHNKDSMNILLDGNKTVATSSSIFYLEGCIELGLRKGSLSIRTPIHTINIHPRCPSDTVHAGTGHIDRDYIDFDITPPGRLAARSVGGVIGQTASHRKETKESLFEVTTLFSSEKSKFYKGTAYKC